MAAHLLSPGYRHGLLVNLRILARARHNLNPSLIGYYPNPAN
jgi:hypothetical protein